MKQVLAWLLSLFIRLLTGAQARWEQLPPAGPSVYFANHSSHLDTLILWSALPPNLRATTRPVAAADYWKKNKLRLYLATHIFNAILVERKSTEPNQAANTIQELAACLAAGNSIIIFPEGTRNLETQLKPFKSGIYYLALAQPSVPFVPVYLRNLNRVLPKGEFLPAPLLAQVMFGTAFFLLPGEQKNDFLRRAEQALTHLAE